MQLKLLVAVAAACGTCIHDGGRLFRLKGLVFHDVTPGQQQQQGTRTCGWVDEGGSPVGVGRGSGVRVRVSRLLLNVWQTLCVTVCLAVTAHQWHVA